MTLIPPKEIENKIRYFNNDVFVLDGVKLTPKEEEIFNEYRKKVKKALEDRFKW